VQCNDHAGKCSWLRRDVLPETRVLFFPLIAVRRCAFQRDVLTSTDMEQPQITRSTTSNFHLAPCQSDFQPPVRIVIWSRSPLLDARYQYRYHITRYHITLLISTPLDALVTMGCVQSCCKRVRPSDGVFSDPGWDQINPGGDDIPSGYDGGSDESDSPGGRVCHRTLHSVLEKQY
jgi:hypothetical protein